MAPAARAQEPVSLSLDGLLKAVREDNPVIDVARAKLADYEALFDRAYYAWTPTLKMDALLAPLPERRLLHQCVLEGMDETSGLRQVGPCPGQDVQDDELLTADTEIGILVRTSAKLTFPIYTFGKIEWAQAAARAGVEVGQAGVEYARAELDYLIRKAYYGAQLAESALGILEDGRKQMQDALGKIDAELEKESGRFTSNDRRKMLVEQAEIEAGYLETEALKQVAWESLRVAARIEPGQPIVLDSFDLVPVKVEPRTVETYLELARASRPDIRMANAGVVAYEAKVEMARAKFLPDIALVGAASFSKGTSAEDNPDPYANDDYNSSGFGVVLGAELKLDFAALVADLRQAEAASAKMKAERDGLLQKIRLEVAEQVARMTRFEREYAVREVAMKAAKGWLVSNSLNFGMGLAKSDELVASLVAYSKARLKYFQAIYEYNLAVGKLSQTVGTELVVPDATR